MGKNQTTAIAVHPSASSVQTFNFNGVMPLQVVSINNTPWFVANDVCRVLRLSNITEAMKPLDEDEKLTSKILKSGQNRLVWLVSEGGLYTLMMRCHDAIKTGTVPHQFRKWVTSEVLPAIRQTGSYHTPRKEAELQAKINELYDCLAHQEGITRVREQTIERLTRTEKKNKNYIAELEELVQAGKNLKKLKAECNTGIVDQLRGQLEMLKRHNIELLEQVA